MKTTECKRYFGKIQKVIEENKDKLIELDQVFGDGDLGISMNSGFNAVYEYTKSSEEEDFGKFFLKVAQVFNESAPSSLGTIISFGFMAMAKSLKGKSELTLSDFKTALSAGVENIKDKTGAKLKDKTILDSLDAGVRGFCSGENVDEALKLAQKASLKGMEETKNYVAMHGRASYHKEKTLGHIDGGAYVAYLIFCALAND